MKIQVLGSGCANCKNLHKAVEEVVKKLNLDFEVEYSTDIVEIVKLGALSSPVFAIDNVIISSGRVPKVEEIEEALTKNTRQPDISIVWQRLIINDNETCPRCSLTEEAVEGAVRQLSKILAPVRKTVDLKKIELSKADFDKNPLSSNEITINGKTLEDWLGAIVGKSDCCGACGDNECRTMELEGKIYEDIPEDLIVRAGLAAANYKTEDSCTCSCGGNC